MSSHMTSSSMDLKAYFQRINFPEVTPGSFTPSLSALRDLHRQHIYSIPFECLSSHIGEKVHLDVSWIFQKMVLGRRGGFCYEHNGLFHWVLSELGFQTQILSARALNIFTGQYGLPYDHMLLTVELDGRRWLCDVGYGGNFVPVFPLEAGWEEKHIHGDFRLKVEGENWYLEKKAGDLWKVLFKFTLEERRYEEFREMCHYHQTSPFSLLVCKTFCMLHGPRGRLLCVGPKLVITDDGSETPRSVQHFTQEEFPEMLKDKFGIVLMAKVTPKDEEVPLIPDSM